MGTDKTPPCGKGGGGGVTFPTFFLRIGLALQLKGIKTSQRREHPAIFTPINPLYGILASRLFSRVEPRQLAVQSTTAGVTR